MEFDLVEGWAEVFEFSCELGEAEGGAVEFDLVEG